MRACVCVFDRAGYYCRPDLTAEALVPDPGNVPPDEAAAAAPPECADPRVGRWFCTGDIAALRPDGSLEIVDRIKNMFKLSQGGRWRQGAAVSTGMGWGEAEPQGSSGARVGMAVAGGLITRPQKRRQ